ncbi:nucleoside permease [Williamwhitmania taraxaci]|uniref:MFS transporter, NHS family, xanthosine permease n=1 Tax=Williamwhitmania taraxaci TaxID=1640674 RepID=A0A1G6KS97_9BACT|nr:nucleoside permease [Williamwhitmania taraxaci]SDC33671.1 MFS transporter, NHS family, xanthosine permease [Williamwhitmania taraxaci]
MGIKGRLTAMNFLQFFVWGSWLITIGNYWFNTKEWSGSEFGIIFSTMGIASLFMPAIAGIIADRFLNAEKLYGILHLLSGITLFFLPQVNDPSTFFWVMLVSMCFYMPTIALANSIAYTALKSNRYDVVKDFPPIRVFGTIGFIVAMWVVNLTGNKSSENQFYIAAAVSMFLGVYSFSLPKCPSFGAKKIDTTLAQRFGLDAFKLFKDKKMALFFVFSMFLGAALQLTNAYGDVFLGDFKLIPEYANSFVVKYSTIIMSISQISETLFILAIPFFLKRFGIKKVMLISMVAWVLRFGLFAYGDPVDGLWMIILSCIVYGMAFDFFNISGSLFVETSTDPSIRSSAQGLFMMMTNGFGAIFGSLVSGYLIKVFYTSAENVKDWHSIWLLFAIYSAIIAIFFAILFKHKHNPKEIENIQH